MNAEKLRDEFDELNEDYRKQFGLLYFPPTGSMHGYSEPLEESISKMKHAIETGEQIEPPHPKWDGESMI
jgi:hypothetical protein